MSTWSAARALGILALCLLADGPARAQERLPTATELVERVIAWSATQHAEARRYTFRRDAEVEQLDGDGRVEERQRRTYEVVLLDGDNFDRLVSVDGRPPNAEEQEEERRREREFRERRAERARKGEDGPFFDKELADRFTFEVVGRETIAGRPAFAVDFAPDQRKDLPEEEDEDRFLNALAGTIWIDAAEAAIVRIEARLIRTVRFGGGLLAYFKKVSLRFEMRRHADGAWLPHLARSYAWGRSLLLKPIRVREKSRFSGFERVR